MTGRLLAAATALACAAGSAAAQAPKLVVVIAIDQFRADYLVRFRQHFGPGGFNLLLSRGANFAVARYEHATTSTCPGHAVMLTGSHGSVNGIIANDWYDAAAGREVNCAEDRSTTLIGVALEGRSPRQLLGGTVGDALKRATGGRARVVTVSPKDRSAIMLGGHLADVAYWMVDTLFTTSTYYRADLPAWVRELNASGRVTAYRGKVWERLLPASSYTGPDEGPGEANVVGMGRSFPHRIGAGADFLEAFNHSPFNNEVVGEFAMRAMIAEGLGRDSVTDILGIGFSANDLVGHAFGPDSHEVLDVTVRFDRLLARMFATIDRQVGLANTILVLTADHGVAPLPEATARRNPRVVSRRLDTRAIRAAAASALEARYGSPGAAGWVVHHGGQQLHLDLAALAEKKIPLAEAEGVARNAMAKVAGVREAITGTELARLRRTGSRASIVLSYYPGRSGNVSYRLQPYLLSGTTPSGTDHSSGWSYDAEVPVLWYGMGVVPGTYRGAASVADIAPTLSAMLGVATPPGAQGRVLAEMLRQ